MTRKLEVNWGDLCNAFESRSGGLFEERYFLDLETGNVIRVTDEIARHAEEPPDAELSDWMEEAVEQARQVEAGYGTRYIRVPSIDSHEAHGDMQRFIYTVRNAHLQDQLWQAISGRGAFRYFKDVLYEHPVERERWFAFRDRCIYERIAGWLEDEGIEPTNPVDLPEVSESQQVDESVQETMLEDLTLLVIYLSSWEEEIAPGLCIRRAWKGYLFEVLDELEEMGYIDQTRRAKSLTLTQEGTLRAQELAARYTP